MALPQRAAAFVWCWHCFKGQQDMGQAFCTHCEVILLREGDTDMSQVVAYTQNFCKTHRKMMRFAIVNITEEKDGKEYIKTVKFCIMCARDAVNYQLDRN